MRYSIRPALRRGPIHGMVGPRRPRGYLSSAHEISHCGMTPHDEPRGSQHFRNIPNHRANNPHGDADQAAVGDVTLVMKGLHHEDRTIHAP